MAGKITISTLNNDTGVLATQNGMTGIAKAWVQFVGSTAVVNGSFNVSSVTRNSTGDYTVNMTTAMANINYSAVVSIASQTGFRYAGGVSIFTQTTSAASVAPTTTTFRFVCLDTAQTVGDPAYVCATVLGS